jgi:hypothetical protein
MNRTRGTEGVVRIAASDISFGGRRGGIRLGVCGACGLVMPLTVWSAAPFHATLGLMRQESLAMQYHSAVLRQAGEWDKSGMCATSALLLTGVRGWLQPGRPEALLDAGRPAVGAPKGVGGQPTANCGWTNNDPGLSPVLVPSHVKARTSPEYLCLFRGGNFIPN